MGSARNQDGRRRLVEELSREMRVHLRRVESPEAPDLTGPLLARIRKSLAEARQAREDLDRLPPQPDTSRARRGMILVRLVRQALFWYTPRISAFEAAAAAALEDQTELLDRALTRLEVNEARILALQIQVDDLTQRLRAAQNGTTPAD